MTELIILRDESELTNKLKSQYKIGLIKFSFVSNYLSALAYARCVVTEEKLFLEKYKAKHVKSVLQFESLAQALKWKQTITSHNQIGVAFHG